MKKILSLFIVTILLGLNLSITVYAEGDDDTPASTETTSTTNSCEGEDNFLVGQNEEGLYLCQTLDPDEDTDSDTVPNKFDNCPTEANATGADGDYNGDETDGPEEDENAHQADSDGDDVGDECDESPRSRIVSAAQTEAGLDEAQTAERSEASYQSALGTLGGCLFTGSTNHPTCTAEKTFDNLTNNDERQKFNRLYEAQLNNEIITTIEEPISNQGIYRKARVCSTKFLRDINGIVQPTTSINLYDPDLSPEELTQRLRKLTFLTTNDKCEEFYVQNCSPANTTNFTVGSGESLPTRIYCDNVQILFASSGSDLVKKYVSLIYRLAAGIIGIIAVVVIIINGIIISASGGESGTIDNAKNRIIQSLVSLAILFLSGIILYSINPNFFRTETANQVIENAPTDTTEPTE